LVYLVVPRASVSPSPMASPLAKTLIVLSQLAMEARSLSPISSIHLLIGRGLPQSTSPPRVLDPRISAENKLLQSSSSQINPCCAAAARNGVSRAPEHQRKMWYHKKCIHVTELQEEITQQTPAHRSDSSCM